VFADVDTIHNQVLPLRVLICVVMLSFQEVVFGLQVPDILLELIYDLKKRLYLHGNHLINGGLVMGQVRFEREGFDDIFQVRFKCEGFDGSSNHFFDGIFLQWSSHVVVESSRVGVEVEVEVWRYELMVEDSRNFPKCKSSFIKFKKSPYTSVH
jgi:hypothetical protein